ncbi:MAG: aspartate/glutamate racemase family protein [Burkholderiaceae bacterium]|jgi:glutamate racemase|nr:aspartate/glutamate racemase family protein [Burkholderiaceae bacterium]
MPAAISAHDLHAPIGVFDAGIGSYGLVQVVRRHFPQQDILYLADRASFPYGAKSRRALAQVVDKAIHALAERGAQAVVLASNAPSVMVLDEVAPRHRLPVLGIYPPVARALEATRSGQVALLGVRSLVQSREIQAYVQREARGRPVALVDASSLVALVEDGSFLSRPEDTWRQVAAFMAQLLRDHPGTDVCTLSSTHLPWLQPCFEAAAPGVRFLDPAESLVPQLAPHVRTHASGRAGMTLCLATASEAQPLQGLVEMLDLLGVDLQPQRIHIDQMRFQSSSSPG